MLNMAAVLYKLHPQFKKKVTVKLLVKTSAKKHMLDQILTLTDTGGFALDMYGETSLHSGWRNLKTLWGFLYVLF